MSKVPLICFMALFLTWSPCEALNQPKSTLDEGFDSLYNFDFPDAQCEFAAWQAQHPDDPVGFVAEASGYIVDEFDRLGVLEIQFLIRDSWLQSKEKLSPDPAIRAKFEDAVQNAEKAARERLARDPRDRDALFTMTLAAGLRADYLALIEKRNMASLHSAEQARSWGETLLSVDPNFYDAYLASGSGKYIVGSLVAPVRWVLRLNGISGDKAEGMKELTLTAEKGHYLAPLARVLLAIAYLREKRPEEARRLLSSLQTEFPKNPLFPKAIAKIDSSGSPATR
jgi:hypothetical protein